MKKNILISIMIFVLLQTVTVWASECTLIVQLEKTGKCEEISVFHIADITEQGYAADGEFQDSGINLKDIETTSGSMQQATLLEKWTDEHHTSAVSVQNTDSEGRVTFSLKEGLYLVGQTRGDEVFHAFLVRLPDQGGSQAVSARPKGGNYNVPKANNPERVSIENISHSPLGRLFATLGVPDTGDHTGWFLPAGISLCAFGCAVFIICLKRKIMDDKDK